MKTVGIIGGVGPETTAEFYLDIIFNCQKRGLAARPGIVISSVPLPFEIEEDFIIKNTGSERYVPYLTEEAKRLEATGVDFIVMPCNSLHIFIDEIRDSVKIPVLSIVEETVKFMKENSYKRVGIVATSATIQNKLYEDAFSKNDIEFVSPNALQQEKMGKIILNLVSGQQNNRDREQLIEIIDDFAESSVDCVALACTDLQLLIPKHPNLKIYDTMKIFADATTNQVVS